MYNGQISFLKNSLQHVSNCKIEIRKKVILLHINHEKNDFEIPLFDLINVGYETNTKFYFKINDVIINDSKLFMLGVSKDQNRKNETNFLIYINNFDATILQNKETWNISKPKLDSLIEIILYNNLNNYDQGNFANDISRKDLYKMSEDVVIDNPESLKIFLEKTLQWGDYDNVVAIPHGKPIGEKVIETAFSDKFSKNFIELFNKNKTIKEIYDNFKNKKSLDIKNIGPAYFTKFLHFYSYGKNLNPKMLILDKWSILAWATLMIEENNSDKETINLIKNLIKLDKKGKLSTKTTATGKDYAKFNEYIVNISKLNSIEPNKFEELMFGWDLSVYKDGFINPRIHINQVAIKWLRKEE
jgi:hypothetical protein